MIIILLILTSNAAISSSTDASTNMTVTMTNIDRNTMSINVVAVKFFLSFISNIAVHVKPNNCKKDAYYIAVVLVFN